MYDFSILYTALANNLIIEKLIQLIEHTFNTLLLESAHFIWLVMRNTLFSLDIICGHVRKLDPLHFLLGNALLSSVYYLELFFFVCLFFFVFVFCPVPVMFCVSFLGCRELVLVVLTSIYFRTAE